MKVKPAKLLGVANAAKDFEGSVDIYNLEWVFRYEVFGEGILARFQVIN